MNTIGQSHLTIKKKPEPLPPASPAPRPLVEYAIRDHALPMFAVRVLAILSTIAASYWASAILLPIILSFFLFLLLDRPVEWAQKRKVPRAVSAPIAMVVFVLIASVGVWAGSGIFVRVARSVPRYEQKIKSAMIALQHKADWFQKGTQQWMPIAVVSDQIQKVEVVDGIGGGFAHFLLRGLDSLIGVVTTLFLIPVLALFFLMEKPYLKKALRRSVGHFIPVDHVGHQTMQMISGFFYGNFIIGLGTSLVFFSLFSAIGLQNSLALALAAGFLNLIPLIGCVLAGVFPIAQALLQFDSSAPAFYLLGISVVLHFLVANLIIPKVIGSRINVNAAAATIGLLFWGWMWGPLGLILAIPLTAIVRILLASQKVTRAWGDLLAEAPRHPLGRRALRISGSAFTHSD